MKKVEYFYGSLLIVTLTSPLDFTSGQYIALFGTLGNFNFIEN